MRGEGERGKVGMSTHTSCLATCTCAHNGADSGPFPHVPTPRLCGCKWCLLYICMGHMTNAT